MGRGRLDGVGESIPFGSSAENGHVVGLGVLPEASEAARQQPASLGVTERIVGPVQRVDGGGDDESRRQLGLLAVARLVVVAAERIGSRRFDVGVDGRGQVSQRAEMLVGGEPPGDVDAVEQVSARGDLGQRRRRRVALGVDPEGGPIRVEEMVTDQRVDDRDVAVGLDVEERQAGSERGHQAVDVLVGGFGDG